MHKIALGAAAPFLLAISVMAQTPATKPVPPMPTPGGATATHPAPPAHPITAAQAHELMQLTGTDQIKTKLIDNIMAYFQRAFPPFVPADVKQDLQTSLSKMDIETPTVATYQKYVSTEDAAKAIEFYKTAAGKDLLTVTPMLLSEIQKQALQDGQDTARAVIERHKAEIETAQKTYQAQHPAPAPGGPQFGAPAPTPPPGAAPATPKKPQ